MKRWRWIAAGVALLGASAVFLSWPREEDSSTGHDRRHEARADSSSRVPRPSEGAGRHPGQLDGEEPERARVLRGRVLDGGRPVAQAKVELWGRLEGGEGALSCSCADGCAERFFACGCDELREVAEDLIADRERFAVVAQAVSGADGSYQLLTPSEASAVRLVARAADRSGSVEPAELDEVDIPVGPPARLAGRVVDEEGRPVVGALVFAEGAVMAEAATDAAGGFVLDTHGREGSLGVFALAPGFLPAQTDGPATEPVVLLRARRLEVEVLVDGRPATEATVALEDGEEVSSSRRLRRDGDVRLVVDGDGPPGLPQCARRARTDRDGRATFLGLAPDPVELQASHGGLLGMTVAAPGQRARIDLTPGGFVWGQLTDATGAPFRPSFPGSSRQPLEVRLEAVREGPHFAATTVPGADGRYRFGPVPPGVVRVFARADGHFSRLVHRRVPAAAEVRVDLSLQPLLQLSGVVQTRDGTPVVEASVFAEPAVPQEEGPTSSTHSDSGGFAQTSGLGTFRIEVDGPGQYRLTLRHARFIAAPSTVTAPAEGIRIFVDSGALLRGTVVASSGVPVTAAEVYAEALDHPDDSHSEVAETAPDGAFVLSGLQPGRYRVTASAPSAPGAGGAVQQEVTLAEGEARTLRLQLRGGRTLAGVVVDGEGRPLPGVDVTATAQSGADPGEPANATAVSDALGRFELTHLGAERYALVGYAEGFVAPERPLEVAAGDRRVRLVLTRGGRVWGRVTSADGRPLRLFQVNGELRSSADGSFLHTADDPDGAWLEVTAEGHVPFVGMVEVRPGRETSLQVVLHPGLPVSGRVVDAQGRGVPGATVKLITEECTGPASCEYAFGPGVDADDEGQFVIPQAPSAGKVHAERRGYSTATAGYRQDARTVTVVLERRPPFEH